MSTRQCLSCGQDFTVAKHVPGQQYCSNPACQRERKRRWQLVKRNTDPDYQDNQQRAQQAWLAKNPEYWRQYRTTHPDYTEHNRARQRERNATKANAKNDASSAAPAIPTGRYQLHLLSAKDTLEDRFWIVDIVVVTGPKRVR